MRLRNALLLLLISSSHALPVDYWGAHVRRQTSKLFGRTYSPNRIARFCDKFRQLSEARQRHDFGAVLCMLADPDPWVRQQAGYPLQNSTTNFASLGI